jgi:hypothetical protein
MPDPSYPFCIRPSTSKQWVFPADSLCRYTYTTRGWSLACQMPSRARFTFIDLCPGIPLSQSSLVPEGGVDPERYCARLCSAFHLWFVPYAEIPSVSICLTRPGAPGFLAPRRLCGCGGAAVLWLAVVLRLRGCAFVCVSQMCGGVRLRCVDRSSRSVAAAAARRRERSDESAAQAGGGGSCVRLPCVRMVFACVYRSGGRSERRGYGRTQRCGAHSKLLCLCNNAATPKNVG